jgi:hypothetical protein
MSDKSKAVREVSVTTALAQFIGLSTIRKQFGELDTGTTVQIDLHDIYSNVIRLDARVAQYGVGTANVAEYRYTLEIKEVTEE